jgi:4-hydroxybenzoate polyprenyltransferase
MKKVLAFFELIKIEHTIFALPFAYIGGLIGYKGVMPFYHWFWITVAMVSARTSAMILNRMIDLEIDRLNLRTADRPLGSEIKVSSVIPVLAVSIALFLFSSYKLNTLCLYLSPIALLLITTYSYIKRFSWTTHIFLGVTLACAPAGGFIGVTAKLPNLVCLLLCCFVIFWVAGFDILYSIQDAEFDREHNLYSIPQRFGVKRALHISLASHIVSGLFLVLLGISANLGLFYWIGASIVLFLLVYQHRLSPEKAFFFPNTAISITLFPSVLLSIR